MLQTTLFGERIAEEKFFMIGFVPKSVIELKNDEWFIALNSEQITRVDEFLDKD